MLKIALNRDLKVLCATKAVDIWVLKLVSPQSLEDALMVRILYQLWHMLEFHLIYI